MCVDFHFYKIESFQFDHTICKEWIGKVIRNFDYEPGEVIIIFTSDEYLLNLNKQFLNHHYYTDIITFNYNESDKIAGELYISVPRVNDNANMFNTSFQRELFRVIIHGVFHLIGYDDQNLEQRKIMRKKEDEALTLLDQIN